MPMMELLPTHLDVDGKSRAIRSDYRNILRIISAYEAPELKDYEKFLICLKRLYVDFSDIPIDAYEEAYRAATTFIECQVKPDKPGPTVVDWNKDAQMIFAAVNKVAGREVRAENYLHWWTFLGYFQSIDRDDLWGLVLTIRQKKAKGRKLEKYEAEFFNANRSLCEIGTVVNRKKAAENYLDSLYKELLKEKG